jgi:hypothetical protein
MASDEQDAAPEEIKDRSFLGRSAGVHLSLGWGQPERR